MSFGYAWIVGLGTVFSLGLVVGTVYFLKYYRKRLLPPKRGRDRGDALAELHRFQAKMRKKLEEKEAPEDASAAEEPAAASRDRAEPPGTGPNAPRPTSQDEDSRNDAVAQLQALQAKMRKKLEEDQARERAAGLNIPPPDPMTDDP
jgi:hypothetical protein